MGDYEVDLPVVLGCYQKWNRMGRSDKEASRWSEVGRVWDDQ